MIGPHTGTRRLGELLVGGNAPIATEALERLGKLYEIEAEINGFAPALRRALRQAKSKPIVDELKLWFEASLQRISKGSKLGEAIRYGLRHWDGLGRYLDDGRIEIDSNTVERSMRPIALSRKNALRRPRPGRRQLGHRCLTDRDLQAQCRRSARLDERHPDQVPIACHICVVRPAYGVSIEVGRSGA